MRPGPGQPVAGRALRRGDVHARVRQMLTLERLCGRLPRIIDQLTARPGITLDNDGDLRAVVGALLLLDFDDVRCEPWPAPGGPPEALVLGVEGIALLASSAAADMDLASLMVEIAADRDLCQARSLRALVRFLYDPAGRVSRARDLEHALSDDRDGVTVRVVVAPKKPN